ncbi:P-loop containing nucleoside triphosphate hydrolase protein [Russula vinacea]|nr:P-loop containing nucleoside triphosphate hydrolase protein [Russula vinacea]
MGPTPGPSIQKKKSKNVPKSRDPLRSSRARRLAEKQQIEALEQAALQFTAPDDLKAFSDLPISNQTKKGLKKAFFVEMTDVQAKSLPVSLKGKDILGAARTGSGKTLCFLIPVLEILHRRSWGPQDGLGALIISPTRELAVQIFDVLRSIGGSHSFSAGIVIGGKNLKDERDRLSRMNILVATPGRLLQHMDQTVGFDCDNLQLLVLDEADRILDMGFSRTLSALLGHLPKSRQTLLFSATQTQSVSDLARLSLQDPVFISTDAAASTAEGSTHLELPASLEQHYAVCTLESKIDVLWSFIKSHLQNKTLIFLSSAKQVRFVFEAFRRLHPGTPLLHLHGQQKQHARLDVVTRFGRLDFPSIDWVVQADAPEDAATYVHRIRASKTFSITDQLQRLAFQDPDLKYLAQRALVSYVRQRAKNQILSRAQAKERKNAQHASTAPQLEDEGSLRSSGSDDGVEDGENMTRVRTKYDRMFERKNRGVLSEHYNRLVDHASEASGSDEDFITLKQNTSNRRRRAMVSKKGQLKFSGMPTHLVFDDDGVAHQALEMKAVEEIFGAGDAKRVALEAGRSFGEKERMKMSEVDRTDKAEAKEKRKEKKRKRKEAARTEHSGDDGVDGPTLAEGDAEGDRYVSPEFELSSVSEQDYAPPQKRQKHPRKTWEDPQESRPTALADDEALALALLRGR